MRFEAIDTLHSFAERAVRGLRRRRVVTALSVYGFIAGAAYAAAFWLHFGSGWRLETHSAFWLTLVLIVGLRLATGWRLGLARARWRFIGIHDLVKLAASVTLGSAVFFLLSGVLGFPARVPWSVIAAEWAFTTYGTAGVWVSYRWLFQELRRNGRGGVVTQPRRVLVVGAGEAGAMLVREMLRYPTGYQPVGFVDDDPMKWGSTIEGVEVIGAVRDVASFARHTGAEELLIAVPSANPDQLNTIVERCLGTDLAFRILPGIKELLFADGFLQQLRPIQIEDLLGRPPVELEVPELAKVFQDRSVLVTGAAGSIGSELSYQIALHSPRTLVLLDQAETPLVELNRRLSERFPGHNIVPVLGDVAHRPTVESVFSQFRIQQVFHAAAYKHVPMVEANVGEAVRNNVLGTWILAEIAGRTGAEEFVLVSTDKAVMPISIMGMTKRLAELAILEARAMFPQTGYRAVRFGNVLESSGSVVPLFRKLIAEGRPLPVTHPEVSRFFMTIREAVQLILQSSVLPEVRGGIAVLDMGLPVRIMDLAVKMLQLAGKPAVVGRDIVLTGLRCGEKLSEELVFPYERLAPTSVDRVRVAVAETAVPDQVIDQVQSWEKRGLPKDERALLRRLRSLVGGAGEALEEEVYRHLSV